MPRQTKTTSSRPVSAKTAVEKTRMLRPTSLPAQPEPNETQRMRMLWLSVAGVMIVVIAGWVFLLRTNHIGIQKDAQNPFQAIFERVKGAFLNDRVPFEPTTTTQQGSDAQLEELRERVFPQFGPSETSAPVNGE